MVKHLPRIAALLLVNRWINYWSRGVEQLQRLKALVKEGSPLIRQGDNQQRRRSLLQRQDVSN